MATTPRLRSVFWVVSTHVLTAGFAMPLLFGTAAYAALLSGLGPAELLGQFLFLLSAQTVGYVAGTFYSFSYLRKVAIIRRPRACIMPSIVWFGLVCIAAFFLLGYEKESAFGFILMVGVYVGATIVFAIITHWGFSRMSAATEARGFPVQQVQKIDPPV